MELDLLTTIVGACAVLALVIYDIWTLARRGYKTTISDNLRQLASAYPIVAFAIGFVVGHLWWGNCVK